MSCTHAVVVPLPYAEAVERTRAALSEQGSGILTEIDVRATASANGTARSRVRRYSMRSSFRDAARCCAAALLLGPPVGAARSRRPYPDRPCRTAGQARTGAARRPFA